MQCNSYLVIEILNNFQMEQISGFMDILNNNVALVLASAPHLPQGLNTSPSNIISPMKPFEKESFI